MSAQSKKNEELIVDESAYSNDAGFAWNGLPPCPKCHSRMSIKHHSAFRGGGNPSQPDFDTYHCLKCAYMFDIYPSHAVPLEAVLPPAPSHLMSSNKYEAATDFANGYKFAVCRGPDRPQFDNAMFMAGYEYGLTCKEAYYTALNEVLKTAGYNEIATITTANVPPAFCDLQAYLASEDPYAATVGERMRREGVVAKCLCYTCAKRDRVHVGGLLFYMSRVITCPVCGNKRCPHGTNHEFPCTGSNEPGQPGSRY